MALKHVEVDGIGPVTLQKRSGTKSIRIHIRGSEVRVTLPYWIPYAQAIQFAKSRADWIAKHQKDEQILTHGSYVGKKHKLDIQNSRNKTIRSKITDDTVSITLPENTTIDDPTIQQKIKKITEKVLKTECEALITPRLQDLSLEHNLPYKSLGFKKLRSRWGSCDSKHNIVINIYLMQLPWQLIDYVLIHELAHTKQANHSQQFWNVVEDCLPDYKKRRKEMQAFQAGIITD